MSYNFFLKLLLAIAILFPSALTAANQQPKLWNIPHEPLKFVGREQALAKIKHDLHHTTNLAVITGMSGIGKTNLAHHYARQFFKEYDIVWSLDASGNLYEQFSEMAERISKLDPNGAKVHFSDPEKCLTYVKDFLRTASIKWLLIFDNVTSRDKIAKFIPETHAKPYKHIILTTLSARQWARVIYLKEFSPAESLSYLRFSLGDRFADDKLNTLANVLGHHPLALRQAVAYLRYVPNINVEKYINVYNNKLDELWDFENSISKDNNKNLLANSIIISIDKLKAENAEAYRLLAFLAHINSAKIEKKIIRLWSEKVKSASKDSYVDLLDSALLQVGPTAQTCSIHPYVRSVIASSLSSTDLDRITLAGIKLFSDLLTGGARDAVTIFAENPNFVEHIVKLTSTHTKKPLELALELKMKVLYYVYYFMRDYQLTAKLVTEIKTELDRRSDYNPLLVARFYNLYSYIAFEKESLDSAIAESLKARKILADISSKEATEELIMLLTNSLGYYYHWQGKAKEAQRCCVEAKKLIEATDSQTSLLTLRFLQTVTAIDMGDFKQAETISKEQNNMLANNKVLHAAGAHYTNALLAKAYLKVGKNKEAREVAAKGYIQALQSSSGDEDHEIVARVGTVLAQAECRLGNSSKAEEIIVKAIRSFDKHFKNPKKNRRQAYAHLVLGEILKAKGNNEEALNELKFAESIYNAQLKQFKVDDISELYAGIVELGIAMQDELLITDTFHQHVKIFGSKHHRTLALVKNMDLAGITVKW